MIYTSYFANLKNLPVHIVPVAICGKSPNWYNGLEYKKLAPKYKFFSEWKTNKDNNFYTEHFEKEVLSLLDPNEVVMELQRLVGEGKEICLICYEKPTNFCHRHLVSHWFREAGINCNEI